VKFTYTGDVDGRGWKGDVKNMLLDISKIKSLGWKPKLNSRQTSSNGRVYSIRCKCAGGTFMPKID